MEPVAVVVGLTGVFTGVSAVGDLTAGFEVGGSTGVTTGESTLSTGISVFSLIGISEGDSRLGSFGGSLGTAGFGV